MTVFEQIQLLKKRSSSEKINKSANAQKRKEKCVCLVLIILMKNNLRF